MFPLGLGLAIDDRPIELSCMASIIDAMYDIVS